MQWVWLALLAGCGRLGFGEQTQPLDGPLPGDGARSPYADAVRADKPLAYWRFSSIAGMRAVDEIGGVNGTVMGGVTTVPGATNDGDLAFQFDGSSGRIEAGDVFPFTGAAPYTIELWARRAVATPNVEWIIERNSLSGGSEGWAIYTGQNFTLHSRQVADVEGGYASTSELTGGIWHHLVATFDGTDSALYRDGAYTGGMLAPALNTSAGLLVFGDRARTQFFKFDGALDDIAIYDRALTPSRIAAHYAASGR